LPLRTRHDVLWTVYASMSLPFTSFEKCVLISHLLLKRSFPSSMVIF
uniref:Ovule protein n=1 Tax=Hydatigena taeniaeformis TaxID=6205 RepID=A0A0R3WW02_HYDTA